MKHQTHNFLTNNEDIKDSKNYKIVVDILSEMVRCGAITLGSGYCISMSEMVSNALAHRNIKSRLIECQLTITYSNSTPPEILFIGFDDIKQPGEIDTHVVVVTETDPPLLIDASIAHKLPEDVPAVITSIKQGNILCSFENQTYNLSMTYQEKKLQKIPVAYHRSFVSRIETDQKIFKNLTFLKILIVLALAISSANLFRGAVDFYQTYILKDNNWGPTAIQDLESRLKKVETLIYIPVEDRRIIKEKNSNDDKHR
jgi:hypothetical protein